MCLFVPVGAGVLAVLDTPFKRWYKILFYYFLKFWFICLLACSRLLIKFKTFIRCYAIYLVQARTLNIIWPKKSRPLFYLFIYFESTNIQLSFPSWLLVSLRHFKYIFLSLIFAYFAVSLLTKDSARFNGFFNWTSGSSSLGKNFDSHAVMCAVRAGGAAGSTWCVCVCVCVNDWLID